MRRGKVQAGSGERIAGCDRDRDGDFVVCELGVFECGAAEDIVDWALY